MPARSPRLLIFVIAYQAEGTLKSVLERIPGAIFDEYDCEVLVVDDASKDRTYEIGREYQKAHPGMRLTVLRNEYNQGYGGNQKVGYSYAIQEGFDFVAMVHGDGQYAPEELPRLVAPLRDGEADAVFGSRMKTAFGALKGGMPLYKYVGNRVLTTFQNALLRSRFSEFHSGYRVYSTAALEKIHFQLNTNDFHFDTEIILQLLNAKQRIVELEIPTYYGDEISRVNGMKYAGDVAVATLKNLFHRSGILYQRYLDPVSEDNAHYDLKLGYPSSHTWAIEAVPRGAKVLDLGGGPGGIAREFANNGCEVIAVDRHAPSVLDERITFVQGDLEAPLEVELEGVEYILMLDVIEHLKDPERFLAQLRAKIDHKPRTLVLTTGNVAFFVTRLMLLAGQFNYGKAGILDRTHTRLFTFGSLRRLLRESGFKIHEIRGVPAPFPKVFGDGPLGLTAVKLNELLIKLSRSLFAYQIFIVAESTPDLDFLLADAKQRSAFREQLSRKRSERALAAKTARKPTQAPAPQPAEKPKRKRPPKKAR